MYKKYFTPSRFPILKHWKLKEDEVKSLLRLKVLIWISIGQYMCSVINPLNSSANSLYHLG